MLKLLFVAMLSMLSCWASAQIYLSQVFEGEVVVGPYNVNIINNSVISFYIDELSISSTYLNKDIEDINLIISELEQKNKLKRKEKREVKYLLAELKIVDQELDVTSEVLDLWVEAQRHHSRAHDLYLKHTNGDYIEITTAEKKSAHSIQIYS